MAGFDTINYSVRPNKVIQRTIAFDAMQMLSPVLKVKDMKYIGFGSIWFADFILAHKRLSICDMVSVERDPILFQRAKFNAPFRTIKVKQGDSTTILEQLARSRRSKKAPWILWLDYVSGLTPEVVQDIDLVIDHAPDNSILLVTLNVAGGTVGAGLEGRRTNLHSMLGDVVAADEDLSKFEKDNLPATIAQYVHDYADSRCKSFARKPGYVPAFTMPYRDGAQMVTVGGILPSAENWLSVNAIVDDPTWPAKPLVPVETPPLTPRELAALQRILPAKGTLSRADLKRLGFDLEDGMLDVYCAHYRRYPSFFQIVA